MKYFFVKAMVTPDRHKSPTRFGIAIRPLSVSAMLHIRSSAEVSSRTLDEEEIAPMNTTAIKTNLKPYFTNLLFFVRYPQQVSP